MAEEKKDETILDENTKEQADSEINVEEAGASETISTDNDEASEPEVDHLEIELAETKERLARIRADYENFRRRTKDEKEAQAKYRAQSFIEKLLPALDNFERALTVEPLHDETKQLLQGMEMVNRQIQEALKNEGVEVIATKGETFDPHFHQAVMQVEEDGYESNQIVDELQKGYQLKDRVIRHSMVKVNS